MVAGMGADLLPTAGRDSLRDRRGCGGAGEEIGLSIKVRSVCVQLAACGTGGAGVGGCVKEGGSDWLRFEKGGYGRLCRYWFSE